MVEGGCLVTFINILLFIWDFITYPFYFLIQQPWRKTMKMKKTRARIVTTQASEVTIRSLAMVNKIKDELKSYPDQITTGEGLEFLNEEIWPKEGLGDKNNSWRS